MSPLLKKLLLTATAFLASCTYRFHTLNTAEVLLLRDKQVVVSVQEESTVKYRYKGKNYYPIKLAYAVDKGDGVIRLACSPLACRPDTPALVTIYGKTALAPTCVQFTKVR